MEEILHGCIANASVAQLVEQQFCTLTVAGSSPAGSSIKIASFVVKI